MWKFLKITGIILSILLVVIAVLAFGTWRASQHEEPWYVEAVAEVQPEIQQERIEAGDEFERHALELRDEARQRGEWEAVFTQAQVNGWLASDLKEKYPKMLPPNVHDPRVKIEEDHARAAFRVVTSQVETVVVVGVDLYLTENPNELAVRLRDARAGLLPVPMRQVKKIADNAADRTNVGIRWNEVDGDQVALIQIPEDVEGIDGRLIIEGVEVREGEVFLSGRTVKPDGTGGSNNVQRVIVGQLFRSETLKR